MKKISIILMATFIVLTIAGCTPKQPDPSFVNPTPESPPVVTETDMEKVIKFLSADFQWTESFNPGSVFIRVDAEGHMMEGIYCAGGTVSGTISEVTKIKENEYKIKIDVPAYAGDDMTNPYDAYSQEYVVELDDANKKIILTLPESYNESVKILVADNGKTVNELFKVLASHGTYSDDAGFNFTFTEDGGYNKCLANSDYMEGGKITGELEYSGWDNYSFKVAFPETQEGKAYTINVAMLLINGGKTLTVDEAVNDYTNWFNLTAEK